MGALACKGATTTKQRHGGDSRYWRRIGRLGGQARIAARKARIAVELEDVERDPYFVHRSLHSQCGYPRQEHSWCPKLLLLALPYFYNIAVWVAYVATELKTVIFWFGEKLRSSISPLLVTGLNVGDAEVYKTADFIGICRRL